MLLDGEHHIRGRPVLPHAAERPSPGISLLDELTLLRICRGDGGVPG